MKKLNPCQNCPFRSDRPFSSLSNQRATEIVNALMRDGGFSCHKTLDYSEGTPRETPKTKLCKGAAKFLENIRPGGFRANVVFRLGAHIEGFTPQDLSAEPPVYQSIEDVKRGTCI